MAHSYIPPLPPVWNRKIEHHWVEFAGGNGELIRGYLAKPRGARKGPAIVQVHENIGVIPHRREITRKLAEEGFTALTVDLYSRIGGRPPQDFKSPEERRQKAFLATFDEQAIPDLEAACAWLRTQPEVDGARIAAIGYCSGGGTLFGWVCGRNKSLKCAVVYYGSCDLPAACRPDGKPLDRIKAGSKLSIPLLVHHGDSDQAVSYEKAKVMVAELKKSGQPVEFHTYPGANHVFEDDTHPNFHKDSAVPAWARSMEFLKRHLGATKVAAE